VFHRPIESTGTGLLTARTPTRCRFVQSPTLRGVFPSLAQSAQAVQGWLRLAIPQVPQHLFNSIPHQLFADLTQPFARPVNLLGLQ
jgi:hypothetical protein